LNIIQPKDSPRKAHELLMDKWGISLFKFAQVFAVSPIELFLQKSSYPFSNKEMKEVKRTLKKMQDCLFIGGRHIREIINKPLKLPVNEISNDELVKEMQLQEFVKKYVHKYEMLTRYVEKTSLHGKIGVGLNKKTIVAVGWGNLISQGKRRIDWKLLGYLYEWFWYKVFSYKYYAEWKPVFGLEEHLRHQYSVHRWAGGAGEYVCSKLKMSESEVQTFMTNLFVQRLVGGKEDYFRDKLPMSETKFQRLFLNLLIDAYLAEVDGLTLFSKNQSFADPWFLFMFIWLGKAVANISLPDEVKERLAATMLLDGAELPYENTQFGDFMKIALNYYLDHKADFSELPPLIVFPDKSCFSTCP